MKKAIPYLIRRVNILVKIKVPLMRLIPLVMNQTILFYMLILHEVGTAKLREATNDRFALLALDLVTLVNW